MIQVDIGGLPPIPFGPATSILSVFQLQHNLLFIAGFRVLHTRSRFGALIIQVDIGGHPSSPFEPPPSVISVCKFRHNLLFLAVFRVLNFRSCFEALNDVFWENGGQHGSMDQCCPFQNCTPRIDLSNELLSASNGDRMPKLRPREVEPPIYLNGTHSFGASSPTVRVLDVSDSTLFLNNK